MDEERKYIGVKKSVHYKLTLIKFYGNLDINIVASELLEESLSSDVIQKVLMRLLQNKTKVDHIIKHLQQNNE